MRVKSMSLLSDAFKLVKRRLLFVLPYALLDDHTISSFEGLDIHAHALPRRDFDGEAGVGHSTEGLWTKSKTSKH